MSHTDRMSMSSSPATIEIIQAGLIRYVSIVLLIFGTFGNVLNLCIFTRFKLRSVPCSWYFLASTCSSFIALYMGCLTRVLTSFNYYPQTELGVIIYCKLRTYFTYASLSLSIWLVIGACADRWASSSIHVKIRAFSNVKKAKRMIIGMIIIVYVVYSQMLYCFNGTFQSNTSSCRTISVACELYNDIALLFTYSLLPASLMLIFGLLTIRNIRQTQQPIVPSAIIIPSNRNIRKTTRQMTVMLFVQVICSVLLSIPISIKNIYTVLSVDQEKSEEKQQLENFFDVIVTLISLMNSSLSFYIFTLTGQIFRKELRRIFNCRFTVPVTPITTLTRSQKNAYIQSRMQQNMS